MSTAHTCDRALDASLWLLAGRPRAEVATALVGAIGALERDRSGDEDRARARDHLLEAALWLAAGRPREDIGRALSGALEALGSALDRDAKPEAAESEALGPGIWRLRLRAWREMGGASAATRLFEQVVRRAASGRHALTLDRVGQVLAAAEDTPDESLDWSMGVEVVNGVDRTFVPAEDFRSIERGVRWTSGAARLIGLVGGRPFRVKRNSLLYGGRAVRFRWIDEELLIPFGTVRLKDASA